MVSQQMLHMCRVLWAAECVSGISGKTQKPAPVPCCNNSNMKCALYPRQTATKESTEETHVHIHKKESIVFICARTTSQSPHRATRHRHQYNARPREWNLLRVTGSQTIRNYPEPATYTCNTRGPPIPEETREQSSEAHVHRNAVFAENARGSRVLFERARSKP